MSTEVTYQHICANKTKHIESKCEAKLLTLPAGVVLVVSETDTPMHYKGNCEKRLTNMNRKHHR